MANDFLVNGQKNTVASQMLSWHDSCKQSMANLVQQRTQIVAQINAMKTNVDYTPEDVAAAQALQDDIDGTAKEIVASL